VATDACVTYYTWVRARLSVVVARQTLELSRDHLHDAEQAQAAGTASRADVLRVEAQLASSEDYLASALDLAAISEENLRIAIDASPSEVLRVGEDIQRRLPLAPRQTAEQLVARALSDRAELRAFDQAERAERELASVERAGMLPRLDLFANAAYANPNSRAFPQHDEFTGTWEAGAQLAWTISDAPGSSAAARARTAHAGSIRFERQALADRIRSEVFSAQRTLLRELGSVKTTARRLAAAEESYRVRRLLFQTGKATSVELLDAETELTRARLDALYARVDARVAAVRLNYAVGGSLERRELSAK
jgi:outer membrane protein TolC